MQDYETIFRNKNRSTDSDEEAPNESLGSRSICFPRKRKYPQQMPQPSTSTLSVTVKRPAPPPPTVELRRKEEPPSASKENRISKLYKMIATGDKANNLRGILKRSKPTNNQPLDADPSYGFASRYSDSKSYFRAHNVDNTIPTAIKREDLFDVDLGNGNFRDVLFPLRSSGGSQKSGGVGVGGGGGGWTTPEQTLRSAEEDALYAVPQKKRVKFDDALDAYEQKPFVFPSSGSNAEAIKAPSLRERIYDFFANLF